MTKRDLQAKARDLGLPVSGTKAQIQERITAFDYNAAENKGRRQSPQTRVKSEIKVLTPTKRRKLQATAQDQLRNHSLAAWMVRKHLDYVSRFHVSIRSGDDSLDTLLNRIFKWHGKPRNLDSSHRFGRDEMFRLLEVEKVTCGDAGLIKLPNLKLQALESDLIAQGQNAPANVSDDGLVLDEYGAPVSYCVCTRSDNGKPVFHHLEPAENVIFDAYYTRFGSQFRGVSPLSTAINTVQDIAEGCEFNQLKAKAHALFGLAIMRDDTGAGMGGAGGATAETADASSTSSQSELDLTPDKPLMLDMYQGDDVKVIESGTPSSEFVEGTYLFAMLALLALDIPITFLDSRRSSFSARIADLNDYEVSCDSKRTKNRYIRQEYSDWVLAEIWNTPSLNGEWSLRETAERAGVRRLREVQELVEWVPAGSPWLDKLKMVMGDKVAISLGLDNAIDAARRRGSDVFKNIDKQQKVNEYAKERGVPLVTNSSSDDTIADLMMQEDDSKGA